MTKRTRLQLVSALAALALVAAACGGDTGAEPSTDLAIVVTTTTLGDVVENVVGGEATVTVLTPVGVDPHDFQASSAQVAEINAADLVVANGLHLEEGLEDVLEAAEGDGANVLEVAPLLDPIPFGGGGHDDHGDEAGEHHDEDGEHDEEGDHDEEGEHDEHEHGDEDPHVWFDPLRMADAAILIAEQLEALDASVDWLANAEAYARDLRDADEEIIGLLEDIADEDRKMVTNHDALGYFADRYDFEIIGVVVPGGSTLGDPSSQELAELVAEMEEEGVDVIFADSTDPSSLADAVSAELGTEAQVVELYTGSLGEEGSDADTLIGMLTTNAELVADALG